MGKKIVDAKADGKGNIASVRFEGNKTFTPVETAVRMADGGQIDNAHAVHTSKSKAHLRSNPNDKRNDNLDDMAGDQ